MSKIAIIDYGLGNVLSIQRAFEKFNAKAILTSDKDTILSSDGVILPGVGAFGKAMDILHQKQLDVVVCEYAETGRPLLGICLGMQILFGKGFEFGVFDGLGLIKGDVRPLSEKKEISRKTPNIGWFGLNKVANRISNYDILSETQSDDKFYFVHSYACEPAEPSVVCSTANFGDHSFVASVQSGNVYGCQFHPEKSGAAGLKLIDKFLNLCERHKNAK